MRLLGLLHNILYPARYLRLVLLDLVVESRSQMLHLEEALIDERLALPSMDVLPNQSVRQQLKHLSRRNRDVVPALFLQSLRQRMLANVTADPLRIIRLLVVVSSARETLHGQVTFRVTITFLLLFKSLFQRDGCGGAGSLLRYAPQVSAFV